MKWSHLGILPATVLLSLPCGADQSKDSVLITFSSGMTVDVSEESVGIEITRQKSASGRIDGDIDHFFEAVRAVLRSCNISNDWFLLPPDASAISVQVTLDGRKVTLTTEDYGPRSADKRNMARSACTGAGQDEAERGTFAIRRIVDLARQRIAAKVEN
jgi:hypothetical protein